MATAAEGGTPFPSTPARGRASGRSAPVTAFASLVLACALAYVAPLAAQHHLRDESDRQAFRAWFVFLADAQFYIRTPDVTDCAALVRHAWREALRPHTAEWRRVTGLPIAPAWADVREPPPAASGHWPLFRVSARAGAPYQEFADARTIVRFNARPVSREWEAARPGDLLYFHQPAQTEPDHLMVFVGSSLFDSSATDFVVYHTGQDEQGPGEVRKVRLEDLLHHPAPRWRPTRSNAAFIGIFRPAPL
jgi:uncharacterized protein YfaT (DUF1175 family)